MIVYIILRYQIFYTIICMYYTFVIVIIYSLKY